MRKYSDEQIKIELQRLIAEYGKVSNELIKQYATFSPDVIKKYYGGIHKALRYFSLSDVAAHYNVTKEDLDEDIQRLIQEHGYVSKPIVEKYGKYGPKVVNRIYGNFGKMYELLELSRHPSGKIPSDQEMIDDILRIYKQFGVISKDLIERESCYSATCYHDRFGGVTKLRQILGISSVKRSDSSYTASYVIRKVTTILQEQPELEKTFPWLINDLTGKRLRIDAYYPKHMIAVEYNGLQHYVVDNMYNQNEEDLTYRKMLDHKKEQLLIAHNIHIVWINYLDNVTDEYLKTKLLNKRECDQVP